MIEQRSPEWFEQRRNRVTASLAGAILGYSPHMTRADALHRMVRASLGEPSEFIGNVATSYGTNHEAGALVEFQMETGLKVEPASFVAYEDWLGASPDGYASDGGLVEIKCPYGLRKATKPAPFKSADSQPHYYAQMQVQMYVTDTQHCHFYQWCPADTNYSIVRRDQAWLNRNLPALRQFYAEFLDELNYNAAQHKGPKSPEIDTPEARQMIAEWDELSEQIERATKRKKALLDEMVALAGKKNAIIAGRKLSLTERAGSISYGKAIKELLPNADLEKWRGTATSYWQVW